MPRLTLTRLVYAVLACFAIMRAGQPGPPSDVWWQMATGRYIVQNGSLPHADIFTYTVAGQPWVVHEWLWEVLMFGLYEAWGYPGLMALRIVVLLPAVLLITWVCFRRGSAPLPVLATVLVGILAIGPVVNDRPQMNGMLFLAVLLALIEQTRRGRHRWLWLAPAVMLLWANIHGSYIMGLGLLGLYLISLLPERLRRRRTPDPLGPSPLHVGVVILACGVAVLVNPHGWEGAVYPLRYAFGDLSYHSTMITEYGPPQFGGMDRFLLVFLLLLVLGLGLSHRRLQPFDALTLVVFLYFVLRWGRNVGMSTFMIMPILAEHLTVVWEERSANASTATKPAPAAFGFAVLALVAATTVVSLRTSLARADQVFAEYTPEAAVQFIEANHLQGNMFNSYEWGGYLIWRLWPGYRVYIDGRGDVMGREFMEEYMRVMNLQPGWRDVLDRRQVAFAVLKARTSLGEALRLDPDFALLESNRDFECFVRTPGPNDALLRRRGRDSSAARQEPVPWRRIL
ncbi:MAG: hypothetical protein HPY69_21445 [Armatimonadetes bacterium]|nr:hypothetical protein [Armatimonadota bacterium]